MAIGIHKRDSIVGLMQESTEGTYQVPGAATDYIQVEPDISLTPSREFLERKFINSSIGLPKPLLGMKSGDASFTFEARAGANGGTISDYEDIFQATLGSEVVRASDYTTTTGSTTTVINMTGGQGANFAVGDMIYIQTGSGNSAVRFITSIATDALTIAPALAAGEVPGSGITVSGCVTYKPADTSHISLSLSCYWANQIREAILGGKVANLSVSNWKVGQIAKWTTKIQGMTYTRIDGAAPHTPTYVQVNPPVVLSAFAYQDNTAIQIPEFSLSIDNTIAKAMDVTDANGSFKQFITERTIKGKITPYFDDTSVANFTSFNAGTDFSLLIVVGNVDSNSDLVEGSITGIYLPNNMFINNSVTDENGLLMESLDFQTHRNDDGTTDEIYIGHG